ncbi:MAG TPA: hypothetical protein ENH00_03025 [Actinobacteria bacterium]|nr:lysine 6-dehydrogenase [bacterium BMS3Bbin01]HDH25154.1 hypothetical protein [Actinomycetota bacterium]
MNRTDSGAKAHRNGEILVVGGYGDVGARVSERLAHRFPGRIVIGGRRRPVAETLAARIGHGTRAVRMDIGDPESVTAALDGVETVAVCLDDPTGLVAAKAVERGLGYVDINADHRTMEASLRLHEQALASGARAVLGIGLAPGVTNLMAAGVTRSVDDPTELVVGVHLSLYDEFGPQALEFMLEAASRPFPEPRAGSTRLVLPYTGPRPVWFGSDVGFRKARWFPFPDQFGFIETLGVQSAATLIALDPRWIDKIMATLAGLRILRLAAQPGIRGALAWLFMRLPGTARPAPVQISATAKGGASTATVLLEVLGESQATADAVATAASLIGEVEAGVWLPEQAFDTRTFLDRLTAESDMKLTWLEPGTNSAPTPG